MKRWLVTSLASEGPARSRSSGVLHCLYAPCQQNSVCRFRGQSFPRVKALAYLNVVLVREAVAAHSTSAVLNATT